MLNSRQQELSDLGGEEVMHWICRVESVEPKVLINGDTADGIIVRHRAGRVNGSGHDPLQVGFAVSCCVSVPSRFREPCGVVQHESEEEVRIKIERCGFRVALGQVVRE